MLTGGKLFKKNKSENEAETNEKEFDFSSNKTVIIKPCPKYSRSKSFDEKQKGRYHCIHCGQTFKHKTSFTLHVRFKCGQNINPSPPGTPSTVTEPKERFTCSHCGRSYKYEKSLPLHLRFECGFKDCPSSIRVPNKEADIINNEQVFEKYNSSQCSHSFSSEKKLVSQLQNPFCCQQKGNFTLSVTERQDKDKVFLEENKERFVCTQCGRSYKYEKSLLLHHRFDGCF